jgi:bifunctional DNA-binding transcriptional regulator/antitoxin component of YhaV-PrlF toxin-antitoxin module
MSTVTKKRGAISKVGQRRQVVIPIPKDTCDAPGLTQGDFVELAQQRDRIVVKPKRLIDAEDTLTPDEERLVLKGEAQIRRGEHVTLERLEHELERRTRKRSRKASLEASC